MEKLIALGPKIDKRSQTSLASKDITRGGRAIQLPVLVILE